MTIEACEIINQSNIGTAVQPSRLGLVCVTFSDEVRFKTITRTRYLTFEPDDRRRILTDLYRENLRRLNLAVDFCQQNHIQLYRLSSALFPMNDLEDGIGTEVLLSMAGEMEAIGKRIAETGLRAVLHPDQFVVLSSDSPQVVENSRKVLDRHALIFDMLGLPRSHWSCMIIHGGKSDRSDNMVQQLLSLPEPVRSRIVLENDEYAYGAEQILDICRRAGVPMVFDVHHHVVNAKLDSYEHESIPPMLAAARATWPNPDWQMVHLSNGERNFNDRNHSDLITILPSSFKKSLWIEVEAKNKELAIAQLRSDWPDLFQ